MTRLASIAIATLTTTVPTGEDENTRRWQKLAARDEDLQAHGRSGYRACTSVVIPTGDHVVIIDTLDREENQQ
jgi:hypothetical protein